MDYGVLVETIFKYLSSFFPEKPLMVQAGTHKGETVDVLLRLFPESIIHTFEPCTESYKYCLTKFETQPNVKLHNYALFSDNETHDLHLSTASNTNSLYSLHQRYGAYTQAQTGESQPCSSVKLSDHMGDALIDLLWLNTESSELEILKGTNLANVKTIMVEVNVIPIWNSEGIESVITNYLDEQGFKPMMNTKRDYFHWSQIQYVQAYVRKEF